MRKFILIFILIFIVIATQQIWASKDSDVLADLKTNTNDEAENEKRSLQAELLISKAEAKAIESLQSILKRKKNTPEEAGLLHRLAELYMRRAKTGRFFDLYRSNKTQLMSSFPLPPEKGTDWIKKASTVYDEIERRFPKYPELDEIIFNNAFALQQLGQIKKSETQYLKILEKFPQSPLVPDSAVALGELSYDQRRFALAAEYLQTVEKFPESKVYTYGIYKSAWALYNLKDSDGAVRKLLLVLKSSPAAEINSENLKRQNLRREALRDLALFVSDTKQTKDLYSFFKPLTTEDELGQTMLDLAKIYSSHSKFKEISVFLDEFTKNHPDHKLRPKATLQLVDAYEALKSRDLVLRSLREVSELCTVGSNWRTKQTVESIKEACQENFQQKSREIASKWWDIWQKNKQHKEFSSLTEQALKIVLQSEDPALPDHANRFAYSVLLFQLDRYEEAAAAYIKTAQGLVPPNSKPNTISLTAENVQMLHNADYGALFSTEKALEIKKTLLLEQQRKDLATIYITRHPQGEHAGAVHLRLASIFYEEKNAQDSMKWLQPVLQSKYGRELQIKAEDLHLDVLNLTKDYKSLTEFSRKYAQQDSNANRKSALQKIELESAYALTQEEIKKGSSEQASQILRNFSSQHKTSTLAQDALLQAASIDLTSGRGLQAASAFEQLKSLAPQHPKLIDGLKESARAFAESGQFIKAAETLLELAKLENKAASSHKEAAADFYMLENENSFARKIYKELLSQASREQKNKFYKKLNDTFKTQADEAEKKQLESLVLSENLEPFATQVLTEQAQKLLEQKKYTQAFDLSKRIIGRSVPAENRAEARLVQASILEDEFHRQSVKTSKEDRFSLVLALKAEKLEKAQTAYLTTTKMTSDSKVLIEAFSGIDRLYGSFIDTLENLQPPGSLSADEQQDLRSEIKKIIEPFKQKRNDNRKEIEKLSASVVQTKKQSWDDLAAETTALPSLPTNFSFMRPYLTTAWPQSATEALKNRAQKGDCSKQKTFVGCFLNSKLEDAESLARALTQNPETRAQGLHHLALLAEAQGKELKALWLLNEAKKTAAGHPLVQYEKLRLLTKLEGLSSTVSEFNQLADSGFTPLEIRYLQALTSFSKGEYSQTRQTFSELKNNTLLDFNFGILLSESFAQLNEIDKALKLTFELNKTRPSADILIQRARLFEIFKLDPASAAKTYSEAKKISQDSEQQKWLERKIEYLKVNFKVDTNVNSGG